MLAEIQREVGAVLAVILGSPAFIRELQGTEAADLNAMARELEETLAPRSKWNEKDVGYWHRLHDTVAPLCVEYLGAQAPALFGVMLKVLKVFKAQAAFEYLAFWRKVIYR